MLRRIAPALLTLVIAASAAAQEAKQSAVQPAVFTRTQMASGSQTVEFGRQGPRVGDHVEQKIALEMRLATSLRQDNKVLEKNETTMRNTQRRSVTTTEVLDGRTQAVLVRYPEATKQMIMGPDASKPAADAKTAEAKNSEPVPQPVQGKAYRCRREPGDYGKLTVVNGEGLIPPLEEYTIVAQSMEMVGRPNPLAEFLAGRKVAVGETLPLPKDVADRLFGIGER